MPRYTYTAKSAPHRTISAEIEAESEEDVIAKITRMGYFPISVKVEAGSLDNQNIFRFRKISNRDIVLFTRQLANLVDSGITIINSFNIISRQSSNKYLRAILSDIAGSIKDGNSLSQSLTRFPYLFSNLYSSMIGVGEASGNLNDVLKRLSDFLEKEEEFRNSLRASLTYPFFVFSVGTLTVFVLLLFVIPRLVTMFTDMGQVLPLPTRMLINTSEFLRSYWWVILAVILLSIFFLRRTYHTAQGRILWDRLKLKLAVFGPVILKTEISRLTRMLSLLLSSGMSITPSLEISMSTLDNQILQSAVSKFKEEIANGASLSGAIKSSGLFPEFVVDVVATGEETGSLEKSLLHIAEDYEREIDRTLKALTRLLEPVIILAMGLIVGFIVLSMLLPIFQINLIVR